MKKSFKIVIIAIIILILICVGVFIKFTNGINVHSIKYSDDFSGSGNIKIECYSIKNYSVEMIDYDSPIYLGENKELEFPELGEYRFKVCIWDSRPSGNFAKNFKASTVYTLPGNNEFKFLYTNTCETHATEIYIGSNIPYSVDKQDVRGKEKFKKTISIPIINLKRQGQAGDGSMIVNKNS